MEPELPPSLTDRERAAVVAALERDPPLAAELVQVDAALGRGARIRFWRAFAREAAERRHPASAVLPALQAAAGV